MMKSPPPTPGRWTAILALALSLASASAQEWTEVKDNKGRKLTVKIEKVEGDKVTFSTKNGKSYTYAITKFSVTDQLTLRRWKPSASSASPVKEDSKVEEISSSDTASVFRTKHFEFDIVGNAQKGQVAAFAPIFEAVHWSFSSLPVSLEPKPKESHFKVKLYVSESDFEISSQETLAPDQPAVYNLDKDMLIAPMERLRQSPALIREIAFFMLGDRLTTLPPWLAVGITEYVAAAPYRSHGLDFEDPLANMVAYLDTSYGLSNKTLPMLSPVTVMGLDYGALRGTGLDGNKSRSSTLLTFYYFAHLDRDGKGLTDYMRALRAKTAPDEALALLANGRESLQIEDQLKIAYVPKKLRVAYIK